MSDKQPSRASFSKDKVGQYNVGTTGITGTSNTQTSPKSNVKFVDGAYNASDLLFKNIDKLADQLSKQEPEEYIQEEIDDNNNEDFDWSDISNLTEDQVINNLAHHLGYGNNPVTNTTALSPKSGDNFCRNCGQKYLKVDNFCGNCGWKKIRG